MSDPDMIEVRADEIRPGDMVDLADDPRIDPERNPAVEYELIPVAGAGTEGDQVSLFYGTVGHLFQTFKYPPDHVFQALRRDIDPERFEE